MDSERRKELPYVPTVLAYKDDFQRLFDSNIWMVDFEGNKWNVTLY
jgi:hypothetical protein